MFGRRLWIPAVVGVSTVAFVTILSVSSGSAPPEGRPTAPGGCGFGIDIGRPFVNGKKVTVDQARRDAGFPILIPNHPLASEDSLTIVWHENEGRNFNHVAFEFFSGIEIILEPTPQGVVPYSYLDGIAELGPPAELVFIHGVPAAVYPANTVWNLEDSMACTDENSSVSVDFEGVNYDIYGPYPTGDLIAVATSLPLRAWPNEPAGDLRRVEISSRGLIP